MTDEPQNTELTAEEIEEMENLTVAMRASGQTLRVALNFHTNRQALLQRDIDDLWSRIRARLHLDPAEEWKIERLQGTMKVIPQTDDERQRALDEILLTR